jgi:hypothetical protein
MENKTERSQQRRKKVRKLSQAHSRIPNRMRYLSQGIKLGQISPHDIGSVIWGAEENSVTFLARRSFVGRR